jgi:class 3 adenylate cyclase
MLCSSCATENPKGSRFCNNCGAALAQPEARRKERKFATALFADLVGSTTLAEQEDPEVVQAVVGRTFDRLSEEIARYEGLLEKFMGDAVLAVFGVPRAHEDDAERAVRAALEMQAVLSELNRGFVAEGKPTLAMRIGVEAGEVLVDVERASGPRDRMLTGDAVNTAARLQTAAEPGHIVVGPSVYASTKDVIEFRELEPLTLKGKAEAVPAWTALRIKAHTRGQRPKLGLEARLVGRDEELAVLKQTLRRVENEGRPALVTVVGPAGVGKSRLVAELEHYVEGLPQTVYWRRGHCLAYGNFLLGVRRRDQGAVPPRRSPPSSARSCEPVVRAMPSRIATFPSTGARPPPARTRLSSRASSRMTPTMRGGSSRRGRRRSSASGCGSTRPVRWSTSGARWRASARTPARRSSAPEASSSSATLARSSSRSRTRSPTSARERQRQSRLIRSTRASTRT